MILGALLELFWSYDPPIGGLIPPHECLGAVLITASVIIVGREVNDFSHAFLSLGMLVGLPLARLGAILERQLRHVNGLLASAALITASSGHGRRPVPIQYRRPDRNLYRQRHVYPLVAALWIVILYAVYPAVPPALNGALSVMYYILPLCGVAAALSNLRAKRSLLMFGLLFYSSFLLIGL